VYPAAVHEPAWIAVPGMWPTKPAIASTASCTVGRLGCGRFGTSRSRRSATESECAGASIRRSPGSVFQDIKFARIDPSRPGGATYAVLRRDPARGPSSMVLRFGQASGDLQTHSSAYEFVLLEGTMKQRTAREPEESVGALGPGSYWFQPGKQVHADSCLTDECLMFVSWAGKRDSMPARQPKK
jgi:Domain of unknown function (DUF4437)